MRLRRVVRGELGSIPERDARPLPDRWRLAILMGTALVCLAIFCAAFLVGLHRG